MNSNIINLTCDKTIKKQTLFNELITYIKNECEKIDGSETWYYDSEQKDNDGINMHYQFITPDVLLGCEDYMPTGILIEFTGSNGEVLISEVVCYNDYIDTDNNYWDVVSRLKQKAMEINSQNNDNEYLNETFADDIIPLVKALHAEVGGDLSQIEQSRHADNEFSADGGDWLVLTDDEADERARASCRSFVDECIFGAVEPQNNNNNKNTWLRDTVEKYFNTEAFIEDAISDNGRGCQLASYDHEEREREVDGIRYYIYRTN